MDRLSLKMGLFLKGSTIKGNKEEIFVCVCVCAGKQAGSYNSCWPCIQRQDNVPNETGP